MHNSLYGLDNLRTGTWNIRTENLKAYSSQIKIGFTGEPPVVVFDNLSFGYEFRGSDSSNYVPVAMIKAQTSNTIIDNSNRSEGKIIFSTKAGTSKEKTKATPKNVNTGPKSARE